MLGKLCISITFAVVYVHASELFPTDVRNVGVGSASMCARVSSMAAAYVGGPLVSLASHRTRISTGAWPQANLAPNKVHERLSGPSRMQESLLDDPAGGAYSLLPSSCGVWGSLQCSPDPIAGGEEAGCPLSKNPIPAVSHLGLGLRPIGPRP